MTGAILVGAVLALLTGAWTMPGGDLRGAAVLLGAAEVVVLAAAALTAGADEVGWGGSGGALDAVLVPYGVAVAAGWAAGAAVGRAARAGGRGDGPRR